MQIIILGMHRSGTSVLARLLNKMGAYFGEPNDEMRPAFDNKLGFWERKDIVHLNDAILANQGVNWWKIAGFSPKRIELDKFLEPASEIIRTLEREDNFFLKDPRLCLTFPVWQPLLTDPIIVICNRNPLAIARSLERRNQLPITYSLALWEQYFFYALENASGYEKKLIVDYDELIQDPTETTEKILEKLKEFGFTSINNSLSVREIVRPELRHQTVDQPIDEVLSENQLKLFHLVKYSDPGEIDLRIKSIGLESSSPLKQMEEAAAEQMVSDRQVELVVTTFVDSGKGFQFSESTRSAEKFNLKENNQFKVGLEVFQNREIIQRLKWSPSAAPVLLRILSVQANLESGERTLLDYSGKASVEQGNKMLLLNPDDGIEVFLTPYQGISSIEINFYLIALAEGVLNHLPFIFLNGINKTPTLSKCFAQLFWGKEEKFSEVNSLKKSLNAWNFSSVFEVQGGPHIQQIRFDPINTPGVIKLLNYKVFTTQGNSLMIKPERFKSFNGFRLGNLFIFEGGDPQLLLTFEQPVLLEKVEIDIEYLAIGSVYTDYFLAELKTLKEIRGKEEGDSSVASGEIQSSLYDYLEKILHQVKASYQLSNQKDEEWKRQFSQTSGLIDQLFGQVISIKGKLQFFPEVLEGANKENQELSSRLRVLEKQTLYLLEQQKRLEADKAKLITKLELSQNKSNELIKELEGQNLQLIQAKTLSEIKLNQFKSEQEKLIQKLEAKRNQTSTISKLEEQIAEAFANLEQERNAKRSAESKLEEIIMAQQRLSGENKHLADQLAAANEHAQNLERDYFELKKSLSLRMGMAVTFPFRKVLDWSRGTSVVPEKPGKKKRKRPEIKKIYCFRQGDQMLLYGTIKSKEPLDALILEQNGTELGSIEITQESKKHYQFFFEGNIPEDIENLLITTVTNRGKSFDYLIDPVSVDGPFLIHCDKSEYLKNGGIYITGWAISVYSPQLIRLFQNEELLSEASLSINREDVQQLFPHHPDSINAGFELFASTDRGNENFYLELVTGNGKVYSHPISLEVSARELNLNEQYALFQNKEPLLEKGRVENSTRILSVILFLERGTFAESITRLEEWERTLFNPVQLYIFASKELEGEIPKIGDSAVSNLILNRFWIEPRESPWPVLIDHLGELEGQFLFFIPPPYTIRTGAIDHLLWELAKDASGDVYYFDEDQFSSFGKRINPVLKPGYSPELLRSQNYIGDAFIIRKSLLKDPLCPAPHLGPAIYYDLLLQASATNKNFIRIPRVLAHKVEEQGFPATQEGIYSDLRYGRGKTLIKMLGRSLVEEDTLLEGPVFSLVILNKNAPEFIIPLLKSLVTSELNKRYEVIVGDTGTTDKEVLACYKELEGRIHIVKELKYHFSKNYNELNKHHARGRILGIMNNDIILPDLAFLDAMEKELSNPEVGAVGSKLLYPNGSLQHAGVFFFQKEKFRHLPYHRLHAKPESALQGPFREMIPAVTGAFLFCRRKDFLQLGGFDPNYAEEAQDIDLCLKFHRAGFKNIFLNLDSIQHVENGTREKGSENWHDRNYFLWKWKSYLEMPGNQDKIYEQLQ